MNRLDVRSTWMLGLVALGCLGVFMALMTVATLGVARLLCLNWADPTQLGLALLAHLLPLLPLWMLLGLFWLAPLLRLTGALHYYSPYLIVTRAGQDRLDLHGATPWDYVWLFRWRDRGRPAVRRILLWYMEGLLALARDLEEGSVPKGVTISATSYIFSHHTARRYGFSVEESPRFAWGGVLTYPTQVLTYSFARGRWALPPLDRSKRATIRGADLCAQIPRLERALRRLWKVEAQSALG